MSNTGAIISKVWSYAHVLRDAGVGYGDYLEQLTYLLFLKMADEYSKPPYDRKLPIPEKYKWEKLVSKKGADLESHYTELLRELSQARGILGQIFTKSQNKIQDPAMLSRIIGMIDNENWSMMGTDVKGKIYEGLLEKNAEDVKSGAGQYFTPRSLIMAMVECIHPEPKKTICDPACGTGGFNSRKVYVSSARCKICSSFALSGNALKINLNQGVVSDKQVTIRWEEKQI